MVVGVVVVGGVEGEVVVCRESGIKGGCRETVALGSDHHVTTQQGVPFVTRPPRTIQSSRKKVIPKRAHQSSSTAQEMDDDFDGAEVRAEDPAAKPVDAQSKRKRKREKEKANKLANPPKKTKPGKDDNDDEDGGVKLSKTVTEKDDGSVNEKFAKMAPSMMADYVGQRLKFWERTLSSVELEDKYIPGWSDAVSEREGGIN